jgi:hypothetical protein
MASGDWKCSCGNTLRSDQLTCSICGKTYKLDAVFTGIDIEKDPAIKSLDPHLEPPIEQWAKEFEKRSSDTKKNSGKPSDESMREVMREAKVRKFKRFFKR